jgi:predicted ABC-type exoprotein transport system permease subunit
MVNLLPVKQEIDSALNANLTALKEGFFDLLAAMILCVIVVVSLFHAVVRIAFAFLGLLLWSLALPVVFLYWLRSWAVARSSSSLHAGR